MRSLLYLLMLMGTVAPETGAQQPDATREDRAALTLQLGTLSGYAYVQVGAQGPVGNAVVELAVARSVDEVFESNETFVRGSLFSRPAGDALLRPYFGVQLFTPLTDFEPLFGPHIGIVCCRDRQRLRVALDLLVDSDVAIWSGAGLALMIPLPL